MFLNRSLDSLETAKVYTNHIVEAEGSGRDEAAAPSALADEDRVKDDTEHTEVWVKREQRSKRLRAELPDLPSLEGIEVKPEKFKMSDMFLNQVPVTVSSHLLARLHGVGFRFRFYSCWKTLVRQFLGKLNQRF